MKAIVQDRYGAPEVLRMVELPVPAPGPGEVLVRVGASAVGTGDWRLRAAAFPGIMAVPGRLMFGILGPRARVPGQDFAGTIAAVGAGVTRFRPGDRVFGTGMSGAHAEYLAMPEDAAIAATPEGLSDLEAAALPFGAVTAVTFLRDVAKVRTGDRVLIVGASGGVGSIAVQVAASMGAQVTGLASGGNLDLVRGLGAEEALDYRRVDVTARQAQRFDVILDTVGALSWRKARRILSPGGRFVPLNFGVGDMLAALLPVRGGRRMRLAISQGSAPLMAEIARMAATGAIRPVIDRVYGLREIRAAHAHVEARHRAGAVVIDVAGAEALARAA